MDGMIYYISTGGSKNPKDWQLLGDKKSDTKPYLPNKNKLKKSNKKKTGFGDYLKQGGREWD
jgi:hypothetical protein